MAPSTRSDSLRRNATSRMEPISRSDVRVRPTVSTPYRPSCGRSWVTTRSLRWLTPRIPQVVCPAATAASSVNTAWWARWNAPTPR